MVSWNSLSFSPYTLHSLYRHLRWIFLFARALLSLHVHHPLSSRVLHDTALNSNSVRTRFRRLFSERSEIEQQHASPLVTLRPCASREISVSIIVNINRMAGNGNALLGLRRPSRLLVLVLVRQLDVKVLPSSHLFSVL